MWDDNLQVHGAEKVWRQLRREDVAVARCTVERLMRELGLAGVRRRAAWITTTHAEADAASLPDRVTRNFTATRPNQRWVSDLPTSPRGRASSMSPS